jgi:hypothetical protein
MHRRLFAAAVAVAGCLGISGCSVWSYAWRVNVTDQKLFCEDKDDELSMATYRSWADQAWAETGACCPDNCTQADYAWGFREGFAEFVYAGGDGEPPGMPPRPYWQADLRSREGAAAASSWFEGYRHGARVAKEGGYRDATTLKLSGSLRDCDACGCPDNKSCPLQLSAPHGTSGPVFSTPGVIPPPAEVVIPPQKQATPGPTKPGPDRDDDSVLTLPSLGSGAHSAPMLVPALEPATRHATDNGRVRTALFQIVR